MRTAPAVMGVVINEHVGDFMKQMYALLAMVGCMAAIQAHAECVYPPAPAALPDGKTASEAEMVAGMQAVKAYDKAVNEYLACLDTEKQAALSSMGTDAPKDQIQQVNSIHSKKYNAAVQELEQRAANFNEQVRAYKGRDKG
jgi:predicted outer membrane protein